MPATSAVRVAQTDELASAFRLLFHHLSESERDQRVANALTLICEGEFDPAGIFVEGEGASITGVMVCQLLAGASALVWPPQVRRLRGARAAEDRLLQHSISWLRSRGAKLVQALLAEQDVPLGASLLRNGFRHTTGLVYMRHFLDLPATIIGHSERLRYRSYASGDQSLFHTTLLRTYIDTTDCPEVNGIRTIEEVIVGHQNQGRHDPERWFLALDGERPVGVLILTEVQDFSGWDLSYLGVVSEARGHGVGTELVRKALFEAKAGGAVQLGLAVDVRNQPAWKLYHRHGFEAYDRREIFLAVWANEATEVTPQS